MSLSTMGAKTTATDVAVRPFRIHVPEEALVDLRRRIAATRWPDREIVSDQSQGRAVGEDTAARALLGHGLRLAQGRGEVECLTAVRDGDRRARRSARTRPLSSSGCHGADHDQRMAQVDLRTAERSRAADRSHGARRPRRGLPSSIATTLLRFQPAPVRLADVEQAAFVSLDAFYKKGAGYASIMNTRPQTIGYGLADSPAGRSGGLDL
jgi:hypothetical protein